MVKRSEIIDETLKLLGKLQKTKDVEEDDRMPSIAKASLLIEHRKIKLASFVENGKLSKNALLMVINWARLWELNLYGGVLQSLGGTKKDEIMRELKESSESSLEAISELFDDIAS